jgi:hypothetical protein
MPCRSSTINLILLSGTAAVSIGILPFLYLGGHMYLSLSAPEDKTAKPSQDLASGASGGAATSSAEGKSRGAGRGVTLTRLDVFVAFKQARLYRKYR